MKRKISKLLLGVLIVPILLGLNTNSVDAKNGRYGDSSEAGYIAYTGHTTVYLDPTDDTFKWQSNDKVRANDIFYRTDGFTLSRIRADVTNPETENDPYQYNGSKRQSIDIDIWNKGERREFYYTYNGTKYVTTEWTHTKEKVLETIRGYSEDWYQEIQDKIAKGEPCYIGVDCIMHAYEEDDIEGTVRYNNKTYRYDNWEEMVSDVFHNSKKALSTHYNKFLALNAGATIKDDIQEEPAEVINDYYTFVKKKIVNPGNNPDDGTENPNFGKSGVANSAPKTVTYNESGVFDVGTAIPADETFNNHIEVDNWYGNFTIKKVKTQAYIFEFTYSGYWYTTESGVTANGDGTYTPWSNEVPHATSGKITRTLSPKEYYEFMDLNLYQLSKNADGSYSVDVSWGFDDNVDAKYQNEVTIPYSISYCGNSWSTGQDKTQSSVVYAHETYTKDGYLIPKEYTGHVKVPVIDTSSIYEDSEDYRSANDVLDAAKSVVDSRMDGKKILTTNDELTLNGVNYLDQNGIINDPSLSGNKEAILQAAKTSTGYEIEKNILDRTIDSQEVHIPVTQANDNYYTKLDTWYKSFVFNKGYKNMVVSDYEGYELAIKYGYYDNEPIKVQTPVIAPISIDDSNSTYQQGAKAYDVLNLDGTYTVVFDWDDYFAKKYKGYDIPAGFTKYLTRKEVRFAFAVQMTDVSGEEKIYEVGKDGYTDWIVLDDDGSTTEFDIYIPSWTVENDYENAVEVKVYANNYLEAGQDAENWKVNEDDSLTDPEKKHFYVATYSLPASVQGVMYGFVVTGINDKTTFGSSNKSTFEAGIHQFTRYLHEKTVGLYNRFNVNTNSDAHKFIRTVFRGVNKKNGDTTVSNSWSEKDELPFSAGKSNNSNVLGTLAFGHKIGFEVKTISNINDTGKLDVNASYRWVSSDGSTENTNIALYYDESDDNALIPFSYEDRQNRNPVTIGDGYFDFTYMNDWVKFTAQKRDKTEHALINGKNKAAYNAAGCKITKENMLYSGDEDQLYTNERRQGTAVLRYGKDLLTLSDKQQTSFKESMQTWFGEYQIPSNTKVLDIAKFRAYCVSDGTTEVAMKKYGVAKSDDLTLEQLMTVFAEDGMTGKESFWITDGFLVLNFDITAYNGRNIWGTYYDAYDMWAGEAGTWDSNDHSRIVYAYNKNGSKVELKAYSGDVAVIDVSAGNGFNDRFGAEPLYID